MRIVKPDAKVITGQDDGGEYGRAYSIQDTIEINLEDFDAWYKAAYWRQEGGLIHYTSVSWYIKKWLDSAIFMSTDMEGK
jgi:hypothetical protein